MGFSMPALLLVRSHPGLGGRKQAIHLEEGWGKLKWVKGVNYIMETKLLVMSMLSVAEGNGTPLQYSCLENPMDGGTW